VNIKCVSTRKISDSTEQMMDLVDAWGSPVVLLQAQSVVLCI
jgi:hypothetical protein